MIMNLILKIEMLDQEDWDRIYYREINQIIN